ncbi:class I SAM-dependent methyltransferase [uncultured Tateyamaria sp.]|uniref:class I SAM-dependent methyltransferase n=1 Tax=uncultured Tateyamaria sp. TaxID=455651 RepID=UPI00262984A7|nr:class I SAM-dependent methyltransferase [uncultured Tateyamaria sp.]
MDNGGAFTDRLFAQAHIPRGATALDVGCGSGVVTFRLSQAVGDDGDVVGIDLNAKALDLARQTADELGLTNTRFVDRDLMDLAQEGTRFDVITCRRVLMYLPDQAAAAKAFHTLLKPDGVLILQEHDATLQHSTSARPLADQARDWIWKTVQAEGANPGTGFHLHHLLTEAGFDDIRLLAEAIVETPDQPAPTADIVRAMLPRIEAAGIATAKEIDIDTLDARLAAERAVARSTSVSEMMFGALARRT